MGQDKSLLPFGGYDSMAHYQYERLKPHFDTLYISTKEPSKFGFDAAFIVDNTPDIFAPTVGIASVFEQLDTEAFIAISVDTPFVTIEVIQRLIAHYQSGSICVVDDGEHLHPLLAIYPKEIYGAVVQMINRNEHKLTHLIRSHPHHTVYVNDTIILKNLNYFEEYTESIKLC
jgi:molybdopterin-guanine dinucleotide biosynthesis protein A